MKTNTQYRSKCDYIQINIVLYDVSISRHLLQINGPTHLRAGTLISDYVVLRI